MKTLSIYLAVVGGCLLGLMVPTTTLAAKADGKKAKLIAKYDKNKNGAIDGDEMDAFRKDFLADKKGELKVYDTDSDGKLSDKEISAIKPGANKKSGKQAKIIGKYDKNQNGSIDGEEVVALRKDFNAGENAALKAYDSNKDGELSDEEIMAIHAGAGKKAGKAASAKKEKAANAE